MEHGLFVRRSYNCRHRLGFRLGANGHQLDRSSSLHMDFAWTGSLAGPRVLLIDCFLIRGLSFVDFTQFELVLLHVIYAKTIAVQGMQEQQRPRQPRRP